MPFLEKFFQLFSRPIVDALIEPSGASCKKKSFLLENNFEMPVAYGKEMFLIVKFSSF